MNAGCQQAEAINPTRNPAQTSCKVIRKFASSSSRRAAFASPRNGRDESDESDAGEERRAQEVHPLLEAPRERPRRCCRPFAEANATGLGASAKRLAAQLEEERRLRHQYQAECSHLGERLGEMTLRNLGEQQRGTPAVIAVYVRTTLYAARCTARTCR
jgi:hypothetical protein